MSSLRLKTPSPIQSRRPTLTPIQTYDDDAGFSDDDDIYRGDRPPSERPSTPTTIRSSNSSSSSSSGSFLAGARLGALASVVEQAITRWAKSARGRSSASSSASSSSSSSSSSSKSSRFTAPHSSLNRRRKRRSSVNSLHTIASEREIVARITRMKALEESRQIPRNFILYLPPSDDSTRPSRRAVRDSDDDTHSKQVTQTNSLSLVLTQLDAVHKTAMKARRHLNKAPRRSRSLISRPIRSIRPQDAEKSSRPSSSGPHIRKGRKGKAREGPGGRIRFAERTGKAPKAWFLDVASPTWEDLRAIGKLLHLHPLTLEDILQQDPRENLDLSPKLGYYLISFQAIETREGRKKSRRLLQRMNEYLTSIPGHSEGVVGETNVYLVVFTEGICCFHYNDVAGMRAQSSNANNDLAQLQEHTDRIRNRISLLGEVANMSSDWIAHGILDSIVDSFFPHLEEIEKEVMAIEDLVLNPMKADGTTSSITRPEAEKSLKFSSSQISLEREDHLRSSASNIETISLNEKLSHHDGETRPRFAPPRKTFPLLFRRIRRYFTEQREGRSMIPEVPPSATALTLRRMARARKLVTSLGRLLASKSEVITQIQKRLLKTGATGLGEGSRTEDLEVAIYMGDIQDHILTLQHSLNYYERVLSESHPIYLSQLRTNFAMSQSGASKNLMLLTSWSMAILCIQALLGIFSMNVTVPSSNPGFSIFGVVLSLAVGVLFVYIGVVRYWWKTKGRRKRAL